MPNINLQVGTGETKVLTFNTNGTYVPEDIVFNITSTGTDSDNTLSGVGYCMTAAATAAKAVDLGGFSLTTSGNQFIIVKFEFDNTATTSVTMNVNGTGAKALKINGAENPSASNFKSGYYFCHYVYSQQQWWIYRIELGEAFSGVGYMNTSSGITTKQVTLPGFKLYENQTIIVYVENDNTASNATMNVNFTGALPIYINNVQTTSTNFKAGVYLCRYKTTGGGRWECVSLADSFKTKNVISSSASGTTNSSSDISSGPLYLNHVNSGSVLSSLAINGGLGTTVSYTAATNELTIKSVDSISDLSDTSVGSGLQDGQVLVYDSTSTKWKNTTPTWSTLPSYSSSNNGQVLSVNSGGNLTWVNQSGGGGATTLSGLSDTSISNQLASGDVLYYNGSSWTNSPISVILDLCEAMSYSDLYTKYNNGYLVPGKFYRITDFTTIRPNNSAYDSSEYGFDLVLLATSKNEFDCRARAVRHSNASNDPFYNSDVSKWQIWYTIKNDNKYNWYPPANTGKGIIYRMIDEFGNDCPYDFKNIKIGVPINTSTHKYDENGTVVKMHTFIEWSAPAGAFVESTVAQSATAPTVYLNKVGANMSSAGAYALQCIPGVVFLGSCNTNTVDDDCSSVVFGSGCECNTVGRRAHDVVFGENCSRNSVGKLAYNITFSNYCNNNKIGDICHDIVFRDSNGYNGDYISNCIIENSNQFIRIWATGNGQLLNIYVAQGANAISNYIDISSNFSQISRGTSFRKTVGRDSAYNLVVYNEDDPTTTLPSYTSSNNGQVLSVNSSGNLQWVNQSGGGGSSTLSGLTDTSISTPSSGNVLRYDGTNWVNSNPNGTILPSYSSSNSGQFLSVTSNGSINWVAVSPGSGTVVTLPQNYSSSNGITLSTTLQTVATIGGTDLKLKIPSGSSSITTTYTPADDDFFENNLGTYNDNLLSYHIGNLEVGNLHVDINLPRSRGLSFSAGNVTPGGVSGTVRPLNEIGYVDETAFGINLEHQGAGGEVGGRFSIVKFAPDCGDLNPMLLPIVTVPAVEIINGEERRVSIPCVMFPNPSLFDQSSFEDFYQNLCKLYDFADGIIPVVNV